MTVYPNLIMYLAQTHTLASWQCIIATALAIFVHIDDEITYNQQCAIKNSISVCTIIRDNIINVALISLRDH